MAKATFASTADTAEKKVSFDEIGPGLYAYTAEGDPNSGIVVGDDAVMVIDAQATPVMALDVIARVRQVTDKPIKYVLLTHYHAVRVLGASGYQDAEILAVRRHAQADRRARQAGHGIRRWAASRACSAPPSRSAGAHLADDHVRGANDGVARPARGAHPAHRPRAHGRRRRSPTCRTPTWCSPATWSSTARPAIAAMRTSPTGRRRSTGSRHSTPQALVPGRGAALATPDKVARRHRDDARFPVHPLRLGVVERRRGLLAQAGLRRGAQGDGSEVLARSRSTSTACRSTSRAPTTRRAASTGR